MSPRTSKDECIVGKYSQRQSRARCMRPAAVSTKQSFPLAMMIPTLPLEVIDAIIDESSADRPTLQALALTHHGYLDRCQKHLFRDVELSTARIIPQQHSRLHEALVHQSHLGAYVKTLKISLPDYRGELAYATYSTTLPGTLDKMTHLQALHITYLPNLSLSKWGELRNSLLNLFSLATLESVVFESIMYFPLQALDWFCYVKDLCFSHVSFNTGSSSSLLTLPTPPPPTDRNRLKSLSFRYCPSQTLEFFVKHTRNPNSTLCIDHLESFTINPWTEPSSDSIMEILIGCREHVRGLRWALGSTESCTFISPLLAQCNTD
ncbi:hypothetical protein AN958_12208 [Leucoagaricus sp. SymC.cos]|nr:hypothetical protein AN958_12208 [Leucoagaricus sp. SymC.cos]